MQTNKTRSTRGRTSVEFEQHRFMCFSEVCLGFANITTYTPSWTSVVAEYVVVALTVTVENL